jgi:hypothetical protein
MVSRQPSMLTASPSLLSAQLSELGPQLGVTRGQLGPLVARQPEMLETSPDRWGGGWPGGWCGWCGWLARGGLLWTSYLQKLCKSLMHQERRRLPGLHLQGCASRFSKPECSNTLCCIVSLTALPHFQPPAALPVTGWQPRRIS